MAYPASYNAFRRAPGENSEKIVLSVEKTPSLAPNDVLIKVRAVSLNYRDVGMLHGKYPVPVKDQGIPASDCAGEVVALGSAVQGLSIGDRVSPIFDLKYIEDVDPQNENAQLGGTIDGVLQQYAVFDKNVLVHVPHHLSWEEVRNSLPYYLYALDGMQLTCLFSSGCMHYLRRHHSMELLGHAEYSGSPINRIDAR